MRDFAETTEVPVSRTKAEIETLLESAGCMAHSFKNTPGLALVEFELGKRVYRLQLELPKLEEKRFWRTNHNPPREATEAAAKGNWEQACRARWRALHLIIKAKLHAVRLGISTVESEFLAATVMNTGSTFGEMALPLLEAREGPYVLALPGGR